MIYIGQSSMVAHSGTETSSFRKDLGLRATDREQRVGFCAVENLSFEMFELIFMKDIF
jgi:hypothetical protein